MGVDSLLITNSCEGSRALERGLSPTKSGCCDSVSGFPVSRLMLDAKVHRRANLEPACLSLVEDSGSDELFIDAKFWNPDSLLKPSTPSGSQVYTGLEVGDLREVNQHVLDLTSESVSVTNKEVRVTEFCIKGKVPELVCVGHLVQGFQGKESSTNALGLVELSSQGGFECGPASGGFRGVIWGPD